MSELLKKNAEDLRKPNSKTKPLTAEAAFLQAHDNLIHSGYTLHA